MQLSGKPQAYSRNSGISCHVCLPTSSDDGKQTHHDREREIEQTVKHKLLLQAMSSMTLVYDWCRHMKDNFLPRAIMKQREHSNYLDETACCM